MDDEIYSPLGDVAPSLIGFVRPSSSWGRPSRSPVGRGIYQHFNGLSDAGHHRPAAHPNLGSREITTPHERSRANGWEQAIA
jgi:hypothetical protein